MFAGGSACFRRRGSYIFSDGVRRRGSYVFSDCVRRMGLLRLQRRAQEEELLLLQRLFQEEGLLRRQAGRRDGECDVGVVWLPLYTFVGVIASPDNANRMICYCRRANVALWLFGCLTAAVHVCVVCIAIVTMCPLYSPLKSSPLDTIEW